MNSDLAARIEFWFAANEEDGEFCHLDRAIPYTVIGPPSAGGSILFTTKPGLISEAMYEYPEVAQFGLIGRAGLPQEPDLAWICSVIGERELRFVGDCDPPDLMVFAWLRAMLPHLRVTHFGINQKLLAELGFAVVESLTIPLSPFEEVCLGMLPSILPDLKETVGSKCDQMLTAGSKLEIEAIVCDRAYTAEFLRLVSLNENG